ncbi:MAG: low molecular weight phosphotyrosine protein phosphatase [Clostridia bacterium]|nr:low molecular weight phosphotyrosine protein phosphatase [Clostridia bacterium]
MHYGTKEKLIEHNVPFQKHIAKKLTKEDYNKYDYIIGMENSNIVRIKAIVGEDTENKIYKLLDFTNDKKDIADPWYTGNFAKTYEEVLKGCQALYNYLTKE